MNLSDLTILEILAALLIATVGTVLFWVIVGLIVYGGHQ